MRVTLSLDPIELNLQPPCNLSGEHLKEWILDSHRAELQAALTVDLLEKQSVPLQEEEKEEETEDESASLSDQEEDMERRKAIRRGHTKEKKVEILDCVASVQRMFLEHQPLNQVFQFLLASLLKFQESEFALIGELKRDENGKEYMIAYARASSEEKQFFASPAEFRFYSSHSLFMEIVHQRQTVIANDAPNDPRARGTPPGHPPIFNFLGIPFFKQNEVIGMVVIANREGGYSEDDVDFLEPYLLTCSSIIQAYAQMRENEQLIDTLEQKVLERTLKLKQTNEQLEAANRRVVEASQAQLRHFACMSHEIRTPLNCIIGLSSLLEETPLNPMQQESLHMITSSGDLLLTVVNDVLDYSKLETGNVEISVRRSNLQETLNAIIHSIQTKASSRNICLRTFYDATIPEYVETDCRRLQQVLYNLLGNAIKFSPQGGVVELGVHLCPRETEPRPGEYYHPSGKSTASGDNTAGTIEASMNRMVESNSSGSLSALSGEDPLPEQTQESPLLVEDPLPEQKQESPLMLRFVVTDYGHGIERKDFPRIFQPFRQASNETERVYGGTGLGLPITAKLVHGLGGTISVASEPGQWSRFNIDLPFTNAEPVRTDSLTEKMNKATVLLVAEKSPERNQVSQYLDSFQISACMFDCAEDLEREVNRDDFVQQDRHYICMFQEGMYNESIFKLLESKSDKTVLLTFGPEFSIKNSQGHFRSLCQTLPSVLVRFMASFLYPTQHRQWPGQRTSQLSFSAMRSQYRDYRVLVAEDNRVNQKVLLRILNRIGIDKVDFAANGKLAVEAEARKAYDVILMDMQMPVMDGLEACRIILGRQGGHRLPTVVFVTAHVSSTFESLSEQAGGSGFLSKPFNVQDLAKTFQSVYLQRELEGHHMKSENSV